MYRFWGELHVMKQDEADDKRDSSSPVPKVARASEQTAELLRSQLKMNTSAYVERLRQGGLLLHERRHHPDHFALILGVLLQPAISTCGAETEASAKR